jgi:hypothetical protein
MINRVAKTEMIPMTSQIRTKKSRAQSGLARIMEATEGGWHERASARPR